MRRVIIVAATGMIALAPLLVTPVAHADECDLLPALEQPGCRAKNQDPQQGFGVVSPLEPGGGSGAPCPKGQHLTLEKYGCQPDN